MDSGRQKLALDAFTRLSKAITTSTAMADGVQLDAMCNDAHRAISTFLGQHGRKPRGLRAHFLVTSTPGRFGPLWL